MGVFFRDFEMVVIIVVAVFAGMPLLPGRSIGLPGRGLTWRDSPVALREVATSVEALTIRETVIRRSKFQS